MKVTVIVLVVLGIVAAMCAVLLVNVLPGMLKGEDRANKLKVLVAARSIPIHTELKTEDVREAEIDLAQEAGFYAKPNAYMTDLINVVGKTVSADFSEGQAITKDKIITDPDRAAILRALKPGMRAYPVRLTGDQIVAGLLTPGCFVDVLVTSAMRGGRSAGNAKGEAVSKTFLERIKVIAVKGALAGGSRDEEGKPKRQDSRSGGWTVTLLVDTAQAEALQLATNRGGISLTLRNPTDEEPVNSKGTVWDSTKIGILGGFFDDTVKGRERSGSAEEGGFVEEGRSTSSVEVRRGREKTFEEVPNAKQSDAQAK